MITREPVTFPEHASRRQMLWLGVRWGVADIGRAAVMGAQAFAAVGSLRRRLVRQELVRQMHVAGIGSLPVVTIVALFIGMILAVQLGIELARYNQEKHIGSAVMVSMLREMGPFISGLILAACVGSAMAAQLGTMTVNDEIAALETMSIDPIRFLMTPRIVAMAILTPVLSFYTCMLGVLGGGVVGVTQLNVPWSQYLQAALNIARIKDLYVGMLKALLFGVLITTISCYEGFTATQGAIGVGQATRRSVITSFLAILIVGYFITHLFYYQ